VVLRREREILAAHACDVAAATGADTLVELGSGTSEKTRLLLSALAERGTLRRFVPFDVSEETLREAARAIDREYPGVAVHAVVGDFERHLGTIPRDGRRVIAFLGGTIGNLQPETRTEFLRSISSSMKGEDAFLLGTDLVKDVGRLEAAYNDAQGITAEFNRNVLHVLNRELRADFPIDNFRHRAFFDAAESWIEMRLVARQACTIRVDALDLVVDFAEGEEMRTEVSTKFRRDQIATELGEAGLYIVDSWTDGGGDYALTLAARR
jgi:L-histidine Nalpha-methyltransferase